MDFVLIICIIFICILLVSTIALIYMVYEARTLKIERVVLNNKKKIKAIHLSDIHIKFFRIKYLEVKKIIQDENPDYIFLTGDYIDNISDIEKFIEFLDIVFNNRKFYFVFGNHDYNALRENKKRLKNFIDKIEKKGGVFLNNESLKLKTLDKSFNLIGIGDIRYKLDNVEKSFLNVNKDDFNIVLSHNPDLIFKIENKGTNLFLCGHFHGGQIKIPFKIEFNLLRNERMCKLGYVSGLHNFRGINIYINRGIGNVCFPLRFLSKPELTVIEF
ncbi:MAG: metallophosphoesterase [Clostridiales bacterium]